MFRKLDEAAAERAIRDAIRIPDMADAACPKFSHDTVMRVTCGSAQYDPDWITSVERYFAAFNQSKRYGPFIFCPRDAHFTHDDLFPVFKRTMLSMGLEFVARVTFSGQKKLLWMWQVVGAPLPPVAEVTHEIDTGVVVRVIGESLVMPPAIDSTVPYYVNARYIEKFDFRVCSQIEWVESLREYLAEFSRSPRHGQKIFCKRNHRFAHDGVNDVFMRTMRVFNLQYEGAVKVSDQQGRMSFLWTLLRGGE